MLLGGGGERRHRFPGHIPERDGIAAGLMLLEMLATERVPGQQAPRRPRKEFGPHRYGRIDTHFPLEKRAALMEFLATNPPARLLRSPLADVKTYDGVKFIGGYLLADAARLRHRADPAHLRRKCKGYCSARWTLCYK